MPTGSDQLSALVERDRELRIEVVEQCARVFAALTTSASSGSAQSASTREELLVGCALHLGSYDR
jgi:hypothetical protein